MDIDERQRMVDAELMKCTAGTIGRVHAKCIECIYDPAQGGTMLMQVDACTATHCPLFSFRPKTGSNKAQYTPREGEERSDQLIRDNVEKGTVKASANGFCIECSYDPHSKGSWRVQVGDCEDRNCPLWSIRPESKSTK